VRFVVEKFRTSVLTQPVLPEAAQQPGRLRANPEHDILQVIEILRCEPAITARGSHVASSPVDVTHGRAPRTRRNAVVRLGARELSRQRLALSNKRLFAFKCKRHEARLGDVWHHSLAIALVSEEPARDREGAKPASFFSHGLLHDIGRGGRTHHGRGARPVRLRVSPAVALRRCPHPGRPVASPAAEVLCPHARCIRGRSGGRDCLPDRHRG